MDDELARWIVVLLALAGVPSGCGGARHRKVAGPPPEYELPAEPDAAPPTPPPVPQAPRDAGAGDR
jgi:hypothetical protein